MNTQLTKEQKQEIQNEMIGLWSKMEAQRESDKWSKNLELWNKVQETDRAFMKKVKYGKREFISIDATYRKKMATAIFGKQGEAWGLKDLKWNEIILDERLTITLDATFYYPGGEFEIGSDLPFSHGGETKKKLRTDVLTKALSEIGFNTDVYMGLFDDNIDYLSRRERDKEMGEELAKEFEQILKKAPKKTNNHKSVQ